MLYDSGVTMFLVKRGNFKDLIATIPNKYSIIKK